MPEIDHVFLLARAADEQVQIFEAAGLVKSYCRTHPGQGTRNVCYAFDNLYLEILWVCDPVEARSHPARRLRLTDRARQDALANPFGIAWRLSDDETDSPLMQLPAWRYRPGYLPAESYISVMRDSDDLRQPFMFRSPENSRPTAWPIERRGELQRGAGWGVVETVCITLANTVEPCPSLQALMTHTNLRVVHSDRPQIVVQLQCKPATTELILPCA